MEDIFVMFYLSEYKYINSTKDAYYVAKSELFKLERAMKLNKIIENESK